MSLLRGVRVLDMTRVLAGPFATMILGDMGADIIKVENPTIGDETRDWGPPYVGTESTYFMSINRNKRSIAVDIRTKKGVTILQNLAKSCDVFIENYIPGKLQSYDLDYESIRKSNEKIIYCSITGYGDSGPYAQRAGYDVIAASVGGLLDITGPPDGEPCRVGVAMTDISTGLYAHGAILAALLNREKTGFGEKIDCNLLSTQVAVLSHIASAYLNTGVLAKRWGTGHANIVPYQAFKTKDDRYLTIGAGNNHHFKKMCEILDSGALVVDERFLTNPQRVKNRDDLIEIFQKIFITNTLKYWLNKLEGCGFPYGPINSVDQVFTDPQVVHNGNIQSIHHPQLKQDIKIAGPAVKFHNKTYSGAKSPPVLGEHTKEVLLDILGLGEREIEQLYKDKIVK